MVEWDDCIEPVIPSTKLQDSTFSVVDCCAAIRNEGNVAMLAPTDITVPEAAERSIIERRDRDCVLAMGLTQLN